MAADRRRPDGVVRRFWQRVRLLAEAAGRRQVADPEGNDLVIVGSDADTAA